MSSQYRSADFVAPGPGKLQLVYKPADGSLATTMDVYDFKGEGVAMSMQRPKSTPPEGSFGPSVVHK